MKLNLVQLKRRQNNRSSCAYNMSILDITKRGGRPPSSFILRATY